MAVTTAQRRTYATLGYRCAGLALIASLVLSLLRVGTIHAQPALPRPTPDAKACAYLPVAELEVHFGAKAEKVFISGLDQTARNTCHARFGDPLPVAFIESHPPSAADRAMTTAKRLAVVRQATTGILDTRDFGSVGCFRIARNMGAFAWLSERIPPANPNTTVHSTTCFLAKAPYLSLALQSVDPSQVSIEAAKGLLEKASARRK